MILSAFWPKSLTFTARKKAPPKARNLSSSNQFKAFLVLVSGDCTSRNASHSAPTQYSLVITALLLSAFGLLHAEMVHLPQVRLNSKPGSGWNSYSPIIEYQFCAVHLLPHRIVRTVRFQQRWLNLGPARLHIGGGQ